MTHPLVDGQPGFPGDPVIEMQPHCIIRRDGFHVTRLAMGTHAGTHLDASAHFFENGQTVDDIPLNRLFGTARLVDLCPGGALLPGARITRSMLEKQVRCFRPDSRVIYRTGWDRHYGKPQFFADYPSLTRDAAAWIASRRLALLGMDTPSPSDDLECHTILLAPGSEIVIVESLARLGGLPASFTLVAFPLCLEGCDGSPIRAAAIF